MLLPSPACGGGLSEADTGKRDRASRRRRYKSRGFLPSLSPPPLTPAHPPTPTYPHPTPTRTRRHGPLRRVARGSLHPGARGPTQGGRVRGDALDTGQGEAVPVSGGERVQEPVPQHLQGESRRGGDGTVCCVWASSHLCPVRLRRGVVCFLLWGLWVLLCRATSAPRPLPAHPPTPHSPTQSHPNH